MHLVVLLFALFASLFTISKETLLHASPFFIIGSRMTLAGIIFISYVMITDKEKITNFFKQNLIKTISLITILGFTNIYLTNILEIWSMQFTTSAKTCLLYSLSPFFAALVAYLMLKENMSKKKWIGMAIGFAGLIPIFNLESAFESQSGTFLSISLAEIGMLGAVVCSVFGWILLKKLITELNCSILVANGFSMLLGGVLALAHSYYSNEPWSPIPVTNLMPFLRNTIIMCLVSNVICYNLYGTLLRKYSATFMSFAGLMTPIFASLFGWAFLNETISWHYFAAICLFGAGLFIFYAEEKEEQSVAATSNA